MKAVEALRQRVPVAVGGTLGYDPVQLSDADDATDDDFEFGNLGREFSDGRRRRGRRGSQGGFRTIGDSRGGDESKRRDQDEDELWPHYTPLYTNMKVLNRKRLDASMVYYRAGPSTKVFFLLSVWGVAFLSWLGFTLAKGSPYIIPKDSAETKLVLSHSLFGAAAMYFVCACLSGFSWYKSSYGTRPLPTMGDARLQ